jgi:hypothetical protein
MSSAPPRHLSIVILPPSFSVQVQFNSVLTASFSISSIPLEHSIPGSAQFKSLQHYSYFTNIWLHSTASSYVILPPSFSAQVRFHSVLTASSPLQSVQFHSRTALMVKRNSSHFSTTHEFISTNFFLHSTASFYGYSSAFIFSTSSISLSTHGFL